MIGFSIELDGIDGLVLFQHLLRVLGEESINLRPFLFLGELDSIRPLVQIDAAVDGLPDLTTLKKKVKVKGKGR